MPAWFWQVVIWSCAALAAAFVTKAVAFWFLMRREPEGKLRNAWALRILLIPFVGGLVYLAAILCTRRQPHGGHGQSLGA